VAYLGEQNNIPVKLAKITMKLAMSSPMRYKNMLSNIAIMLQLL
jgi:hypothetical protein